MLSDDKVRGEHEARVRLEKGCHEIGEAKRTLEELKFVLAEKKKLNCGLIDELNRAKRFLDEKCVESSRTKEESLAKSDLVSEEHHRLSVLQNDIDQVKNHRAKMYQEILRLKEIVD